ncbi:hypothetical protein BSAF29S_05435 [Bacillus safensis subsp. safensis]
MAEAGIRVNAIAPGFFLTSQNKNLLLNEDGDYTERSHKIISNTPMRRFGTPEDLLGTLLWLVDDHMSAFVTGVTIPVDGGFYGVFRFLIFLFFPCHTSLFYLFF